MSSACPACDPPRRFLTYNPSRRIAAEEALKHDYFHEMPLPVDPSMFPTWPARSEQTRRVHGNTPKPPSGGKAYAKLMVGDGPRGQLNTYERLHKNSRERSISISKKLSFSCFLIISRCFSVHLSSLISSRMFDLGQNKKEVQVSPA